MYMCMYMPIFLKLERQVSLINSKIGLSIVVTCRLTNCFCSFFGKKIEFQQLKIIHIYVHKPSMRKDHILALWQDYLCQTVISGYRFVFIHLNIAYFTSKNFSKYSCLIRRQENAM